MSEDAQYIQLITKARLGDQTGMEELATLVWKRLYPFVARTTLNRDFTEDVIQDTLLVMVSRLESLRDPYRFWPWIYRIAWSKIQDRLRNKHLRCCYENSVYVNSHDRCDTYRQQDNLLAVTIRREILNQVKDAVEQLDNQYRDVFRLRFYERLPYAKIARLTSTTPAKARVRFHRAKKFLKARLLACCL